ncbi:hypothetical protein [Jatrophihabitans endophyticus]|jgi:hypothetical protein|uniref:hypothetical protein n=1 Tax=Jatrophihabitans endophyticus TaxID=1206085 RepID=UPI0019E35715|nr:hypothetical protein [Jatrophihabitans endophyticus]MBE7190728.1 hypothetical protein [Jatrophihabitans endophyticus]
MLTASWSSTGGVAVASTDLPAGFARALHRIGHDLHVRQFNGSVERIEFEARFETDLGAVWLHSNVTTRGSGPRGFGVSGGGIVLDATDEQIVVNFADLVQDQIARTGVAWPKGDARGVLRPVLTSDVATWTDGDSVRAAIGDLAAAR